MSATTRNLDGGLSSTNGNDTLDRNLPLHIKARRNKYVPAQDIHLRNNLMIIVGYLEFFNALDFPANVWNDIPIPAFAKGLMITGGTVALLGSIFAILDFRRSLRNSRLLMSERKFIQNEIEFIQWKGGESRYLQAWLMVNFRELGWELIDRMLQDVLVGFASVLVGTGTIMAVGGANPSIFLASNLLSGWIGNGFVAFYALCNAVWSVYLYIRAKRHKVLIRDHIRDPATRRRAVRVFRSHQIYAVLNAVTLLVSGAGSLITSKHWWGYFMLIPCVFSSIFCNLFWRFRVGYSRILLPHRSYVPMDIDAHITSAIASQTRFRNQHEIDFDQLSRGSLVALICENDMLEDLCVILANTQEARRFLLTAQSNTLYIDRSVLESIDYAILLNAVRTCVGKFGLKRAVDGERMLYEFLGAFLSLNATQPKEPINRPTLPEESAVEKNREDIQSTLSSSPLPNEKISEEPKSNTQDAQDGLLKERSYFSEAEEQYGNRDLFTEAQPHYTGPASNSE